jgi:hypothetical protein
MRNNLGTSKSRVDELGRAFAGSQLQIQIYVNRRQEDLFQALKKALPSLASSNTRLHWVSPLEKDRFIEYKDAEFLLAVGLAHLAPKLKEFWPFRGPNWDALAAVEVEKNPDDRGVVLVEAKSHPSEIYGGGCQASSPASLSMIETALQQTKRWLGVAAYADWTGPLYQSANRLGHLYFFHKVVDVQAWLVNVYFINDPHSPTTRQDWSIALKHVKKELGLTGILVPNTSELFLEGKDRIELIRQTDRSAEGT